MEDVRMPKAIFFGELQEGKRDCSASRQRYKEQLRKQLAQVVSVTAGLTSDLDWPALAALWSAFFILTCRASSASSFFMILMKLCAVEQVFCEMIIGLCRRSVL